MHLPGLSLALRTFAGTADGLRIRALDLRGIKRRFVTHAEGRLHVLELAGHGSLPPVLVLHGLGSCAADEVPFLRALQRRCRRVFAMDLPAHGHSSAPADGMLMSGLEHLRAGLRAVSDEPVVVVGNSLGGFAAVRLAAAEPTRVAGLYLLAPGGAPLSDTELSDVLRAFRASNQREVLDFLDRTFVNPLWYRQVAALLVRGRAARPALRRAIQRATTAELLAPEELRSLRIPVHVLWGEREQLLPSHGQHFFEAHLPPGAVSVARGIGHAPQHQDLRYTIEKIEVFLRTLEPHRRPGAT